MPPLEPAKPMERRIPIRRHWNSISGIWRAKTLATGLQMAKRLTGRFDGCGGSESAATGIVSREYGGRKQKPPGSVAPSPRWRVSAIYRTRLVYNTIETKIVELALHRGGGATRPGSRHLTGRFDGDGGSESAFP